MRSFRRKQSGTIVLVLLLAMLVVGSYFFMSALGTAAIRVERDRATNEALRQAKEALIAYAVSDANRPGELPCPDVDNDGSSTPVPDYSGSNCASLIGRLPWRTLGVPDLRDDSGERLWYALSNDFHASGVVPLNSDTAFRAGHTSLAITGTQAASNVVAIVFAPGAPLIRAGGAAIQDRSSAGSLAMANYLDTAAAGDNADGNTAFVSAERTESFNDRLLPIHSDEIMSLVQRRAGREAAQHLRDHFDAWQNPTAAGTTFSGFRGFYPWAAPLNDPSATTAGINGTLGGQLPLSSSSVLWNAPSATLGACAGANTTVITCTAASFFGLLEINGRVRNVATAFVDPPGAANVSVSGFAFGQEITWTLNPAAQALDFRWRATLLGLATVTVSVPQTSAWTVSSWLTENAWHQNVHYAVSPGYAINGTGNCVSDCLTIANTTAPNDDKHAIVVMTGRALAGQPLRPVAAPADMGDFLEGANALATTLNPVYEVRLHAADFNDFPVVVRP